MTQTIAQEAFDAVREWERSHADASEQGRYIPTNEWETVRYNYQRAEMLLVLAQVEQLKRIADWLEGTGCDHES